MYCKTLFLYFLPSSFDFAFDLARLSSKEKLPEIHLKHAIYLEDEVSLSRSGCIQSADTLFLQMRRIADTSVLWFFCCLTLTSTHHIISKSRLPPAAELSACCREKAERCCLYSSVHRRNVSYRLYNCSASLYWCSRSASLRGFVSLPGPFVSLCGCFVFLLFIICISPFFVALCLFVVIVWLFRSRCESL